jgi:micrococcal nuclease
VTTRICRLLLCLCLILALPACADEPVSAQQGIVTWVHDGDTLEVDPVGKVRLVGIDTPERGNSERDRYLADKGIPAAKQREISRVAKEFNIRHVKGKQVRLILESPPRDRHSRMLAYVYLPDGRLLNRLLIEQGLAVVYRKFTFKKKEDFLAAEEQARKDKLGLWAE